MLKRIISEKIVQLQNGKIFLTILISFLLMNLLFRIWLPGSDYGDNSTVLGVRPPSPVEYRYLTGYANWEVDPKMIASLKQADVISVGSSLCVFTLSSRMLYDYFDRYDKRFYNLCLPGNDVIGSELIIQKYDLHPEAVILFNDYVSFNRNFDHSKYFNLEKENTINASLEVWKDIIFTIELEEPIYTHYIMEKITPYTREYFRDKQGVSFGGPATKAHMFVRRDGSSFEIYSGQWDNRPVNVKYSDYIHKDWIDEESIQVAKNYKNILQQNGIQLIIVPLDTNNSEFNIGTAKKWSEMLDVPVIIPDPNDIPTYSDTLEGNHFYGNGADELVEAYINVFEKYFNEDLFIKN